MNKAVSIAVTTTTREVQTFSSEELEALALSASEFRDRPNKREVKFSWEGSRHSVDGLTLTLETTTYSE